MVVRTFYWHDPHGSRPRGNGLRIGNAGDLYNRDLLRHAYGGDSWNLGDEGRRLLLVGSTAHRALDGDVLAGVGTKGVAQPLGVDALVWACRGPLTLDALTASGLDTSDVRFLADPGLIVDQVYPRLQSVRARRNRVIFIPHYRDRRLHRSTRRYRVVDVDAEPERFATEIARAEHVYSASLHGIVFAHALGRPVTPIATDGAEPEIKYRDYFASLGLAWRRPPTIDEAVRDPARTSPIDVPAAMRSLPMPPSELLASRGIIASAPVE